MIGDHGKELLVFLCISLRKLLRKGLLGKSTLSRVARIRNTDCGGGQLTSPDCNEFGLGARRRCKSEADTTGIDNEVKLASTKSIHPLVPLNVDGDTGGVDGSGWCCRRRQSEATTTGTMERLLNVPGRSIIRNEVSLKNHLKLSEGGRGERVHKRTSEEGNGISDSLRKVCGGRGHG